MLFRIFKIFFLIGVFVLLAGLSAYYTMTFIIKGEDTVVVPDLTGKDVVTVLEVLSEMDLHTKVKGADFHVSVPKNFVIFQDPMPGYTIKKGREVQVVISKGTSTVQMPNFSGIELAQAKIIIDENGLCTGSISRTHADLFKTGWVIAQAPRAGTLVNKGQCVNLLVSLGEIPAEYKMFDLVSMGLDEAILAIEKNGLSLGEIKRVYDHKLPKNVITGQDPRFGYRVKAGGRVDLVLNRKPDQGGGGGLLESNGLHVFRHRLDDGFLKQKVVAEVIIFNEKFTLIDGYMKPGEEVMLIFPMDQDSTIFLYVDGKLEKATVFNEW